MYLLLRAAIWTYYIVKLPRSTRRRRRRRHLLIIIAKLVITLRAVRLLKIKQYKKK